MWPRGNENGPTRVMLVCTKIEDGMLGQTWSTKTRRKVSSYPQSQDFQLFALPILLIFRE